MTRREGYAADQTMSREEEQMHSSRKTAVVATAAAVGQSPLLESLAAPGRLVEISAGTIQLMSAALLELIMVAAVLAIPVILFPVLREHDEGIARGYLVARSLAAAVLVVPVISLLQLPALSREFAAAASETPHFQTLGDLLVKASDWTVLVGGQIVLGVSALILNYSLCRTRLVPRLVSIWGLIGVPRMLAGGVSVMFGAIRPSSAIQIGLMLPLAVQGMAFAVWLIGKGFHSTAATSG